MCAARRAYRCGHRGRRRTARIQRIGAAAGRFAACDHGGPEPSLQRGQARLARCPPSPHNHGIDSLTCTSNSCTSFCSGCAHRNSREAERCEDLARGFGGDVELCVDAAEHRWRGRSLRRLPVSGHSRSRLRKPGPRRDEYKRSPHRVRWLVSRYIGLDSHLSCSVDQGKVVTVLNTPHREGVLFVCVHRGIVHTSGSNWACQKRYRRRLIPSQAGTATLVLFLWLRATWCTLSSATMRAALRSA